VSRIQSNFTLTTNDEKVNRDGDAYLHVHVNRQFQLFVYVCRGGGWEVRYPIANYAEKNKNGDRVNTEC
jgi:hypothetical protein